MGSELGGPAKKSPRTRRRPVDSGILYVALGSWDLRSTANPVVSCQAKSQSTGREPVHIALRILP